MSFDHYCRAVPELFSGTNTSTDPAETTTQRHGIDIMAKKPTSKHDFVAIIEHHSETPNGPEVKILPAERYFPGSTKKIEVPTKYEDYVLVLRRTYHQSGRGARLISVELEIQSETLCNALRKTAINLYDGSDLKTFPIKLSQPFRELFFYRNEIEEWARKDTEDETLRHDAGVLLSFILENNLFSSIVDDHKKYHKHGSVVNDILWTIYPPNSLVVLNSDKIRECWICRNVNMEYTHNAVFWLIEGLQVGFDGQQLGMVRRTFRLPFAVVKVQKISDLQVIPIDYLKDASSVREQLKKRESNLQRLLGTDFKSSHCQQYTGPSLRRSIAGFQEHVAPLEGSRRIDDRVVVDLVTFGEQVNDLPVLVALNSLSTKLRKGLNGRGFVKADGKGKSNEESEEDESEDGDSALEPGFEESKVDAGIPAAYEEAEGHQSGEKAWYKKITRKYHITRDDISLLYPALVPAFGLKQKEWRWVLTDELQDVAWNKNAFGALRVEDDTKDLIQTLVKGHKTDTTAFDDIVSGKGQGLVFLLHGEPGIGKTLTAESVADFLERPLYSISGGELGTDVTQVESKLQEIFALAKAWNAVVLLDEADVLLCKRISAEIERNAIVGVLLRRIEYFQGVLFLTTNRKNDFDDAFMSRIHMSISYKPLEDDVRAAIWKQLIQLNRTRLEIDQSWTEDVYQALGKFKYNGRTIKNILRTAAAYANAKGCPLSCTHIKKIIIAATDDKGKDDLFNEQIENLNLVLESRTP